MLELGRGGPPLRIAYGRFFHEANAFSPLPTTKGDLLAVHRLEGEALARACGLRGREIAGYLAHAELTGFVQAARLCRRVETVPLASSLAVSGGPLERAAFDWVLDDLVARIREAGPLDGVYLALHGSMQVAGLGESPEALILRRVREALGPRGRLAASFDLHGNLTSGIVEALDVLVAYRTNPHRDLARTGFRAGNLLIRALRGACTPVHAWRKLPMVLGGGTTIDVLPPMRAVFGAMKRMERDRRVLTTSLFMVHPYTSAADLGWAAHVTTDGDRDLAERLADELADLAWSVRNVPMPPTYTPREAIARAAASRWRRLGPVSFVDVDDIVGAGAPGGNTRILQALLADAHGLRALVPLHDPAAVAALWPSPVGATEQVVLRGTPGYEQPELALRARIAAKSTTDFGRALRLEAGTVAIAITERPPMPVHPRFWRELGVRPREADVIVQKNFFHYRMFYAAISFVHLPVVTDGASSLERVRTRAYRVPTHPGSDPGDWRRWDPLLRGASAASPPERSEAQRSNAPMSGGGRRIRPSKS